MLFSDGEQREPKSSSVSFYELCCARLIFSLHYTPGRRAEAHARALEELVGPRLKLDHMPDLREELL